MAPRPPVAGVVQLNVKGLTGGDNNWLNKLHMSYTGLPPTGAALVLWAGEVTAAWAADISPLQDTETSMTEVEVTDLSSDMGAVGIDPTGAAGTRAGSMLPAQTATLVSYTMGRHYRGGHPRTYLLGGVQADLVAPNQWTTGYVDAVGTGLTSFFTAIHGAVTGFTPNALVQVSYFGGVPTIGGKSQPRAIPLVDVLGAHLVSPRLASQRRRIGRK
jgi:hypothetical protein